MTRLLDTIDRPQDLHGLGDEQLAQVAQEVREHIIDTVGEIGGHFGANLGTCELAVALHSVLALEGLDGPATIPYRRFAAELGVVFQIVDDILDVTGDEAETGKPRGSDERHGKATYVSVYGLERARELARSSHAGARAALDEAAGDTARLARVADYILTRTA